jgi:hypothetical protein
MHCGLYRLLVNNGRVFGFMALFSCITLLMLLFWSTISKDYDGQEPLLFTYQ